MTVVAVTRNSGIMFEQKANLDGLVSLSKLTLSLRSMANYFTVEVCCHQHHSIDNHYSILKDRNGYPGGKTEMDCKSCKFKSAAFQKLTDEQLFKVDEHRVELSFKQGELLSKQGMLMSHIIYIRQGFAKLYLENDGESVILGIAQPGTFVGIQALYGNAVFPFSVEAMTDTEVCMKDVHVFRELVLENSEFAKGIIEVLNANLLQSYNRMFSLTTKQINGRFSELLFYLRNVLYESNPFNLTISRRELADLVSTTPESVSRLLHEFKEQGIINVKGHTIEILDSEKLESLCKCKSLLAYKV
jgi:CRP-like cAMP-binding protein